MVDKVRSKPASGFFGIHSFVIAGGLLGLLGAACFGSAAEGEAARPLPAARHDVATHAGMQTAIFAGGCFWGVQGVFQHVEGVSNALSGYAGGDAETAHYDEVESGTTGHAEAVQITFDPGRISYGRLLQIYFSVAHDPTQLDSQGPDSGPQYRSAIFPADEEQAKVASDYIGQLEEAGLFKSKITTLIEPGKAFYRAEAYHQDYMTENPLQPYIIFNEQPKIENLKKLFPQVYREAPVLVADSKS